MKIKQHRMGMGHLAVSLIVFALVIYAKSVARQLAEAEATKTVQWLEGQKR